MLTNLLSLARGDHESRAEPEYPVVVRPPWHRRTRGRVLLSYLEQPLHLPDTSPQFLGHSNLWGSRTIAAIFTRLGYQVDAISWTDRTFTPSCNYDIVFDIFANLPRLVPLLGKDTIKLLHCTGSDPYYQNAAEMRRVADFNRRHQANYLPKRMIADPESTYLSLEMADACSLIGNEHTRDTYPEKYRSRMELVTVSASVIGKEAGIQRRTIPKGRSFLWFFGGGVVHKGLDLLIDVFARHPELRLHIVGNAEIEGDFFEIYRKELTATSNIRYHGFLLPTSHEFQELLEEVFCFVAPSCSEGISPSVATCLQLGLYPVISFDTGVSLPDNCGRYIKSLTTEEVERLVLSVMDMKDDDILHQIQQTQADALSRFSRSVFVSQMTGFIVGALSRFRYV